MKITKRGLLTGRSVWGFKSGDGLRQFEMLYASVVCSDFTKKRSSANKKCGWLMQRFGNTYYLMSVTETSHPRLGYNTEVSDEVGIFCKAICENKHVPFEDVFSHLVHVMEVPYKNENEVYVWNKIRYV